MDLEHDVPDPIAPAQVALEHGPLCAFDVELHQVDLRAGREVSEHAADAEEPDVWLSRSDSAHVAPRAGAEVSVAIGGTDRRFEHRRADMVVGKVPSQELQVGR